MKCSYCGRKGNKLKKVGPNLKYCDDECYLINCLKRHPGTALYNMIARMRPDLVKEADINASS